MIIPGHQRRPLVLIILDGWGYRTTTVSNAIAAASTPCWDWLWGHYPHALLAASGAQVGLPKRQMGNSEVGHMHLGAGRLLQQDLTRINLAIANGDFFTNKILHNIATKTHNRVHILGLLSSGGVHSHEQHIHALLDLLAQYQHPNLYLHVFLDGRDTPPGEAQHSLAKLSAKMRTIGCGKISSVIGRFYALDRNLKWDRIQTAYELIVNRQAKFVADDALSALLAAYERGESDEFVQATICGDPSQGAVQDNDTIIFMNFRADRARQLSTAFLAADFPYFARRNLPKLDCFASLTEYDHNLPALTIFPPETITNDLGAIISQHGLKQLRIAETEKYAHVTYFFNCGREEPLAGEDRILIPSPAVKHYNLQPEMSAGALTASLIAAIEQQKYQLIICNYANADMVGHSGDFAATVKAIETIDQCLAAVSTALDKTGAEAIITADHGNAENMFNTQTHQVNTAHTTAQVPAIYIGRTTQQHHNKGALTDIAPTILHLLNLPIPQEMTGKILFTI